MLFSIVHRRQPERARKAASRWPAFPRTPDRSGAANVRSRARPTTKSRRVVLALVSASRVGAIALAASGLADRARSRQEVAEWTNEQAIPTVRLVKPDRGPSEQDLVLPGNVSAFYSGSLFARASGYVASWNKDIGAHVSKGEVLATISAPDLDQQLEEAKAQLAQLQAAVDQAQANADLAKRPTRALRSSSPRAGRARSKETRTTSRRRRAPRRWRSRRPMSFRSRRPSAGCRSWSASSRSGALRRRGDRAQRRYRRSRQRRRHDGPRAFSGGRHTPDAYLRERAAGLPRRIAPGVKATLRLPGQKETFEAEMASTSNSLAENSRTALVELQADNPDGKLWPGAFAEVHFHIPSDPQYAGPFR